MGSFFTSVHVRTDDVAALASALHRDAEEAGLIQCEHGDRCHREILIAPPAGGWVAVYDEATERQDPRVLAALAGLAARTANRHAFAILVHDSDILQLFLFGPDGAQLDTYDSAPSYFREASAAELAAVAGCAEQWAPVLAPAARPADLAAAWKGTHAEEVLGEVAHLLGVPGERVATSQRYLTRGPIDPGWTRLRFRRSAPAEWERPASGPPVPVSWGGTANADLRLGERVTLAASARNTGGGAIGVNVIASGGMIIDDQIAIERGELVIGPAPGAQGLTRIPLAFTDGQHGGGRARIAAAPTAVIPPGPAMSHEQAIAFDRRIVQEMLGFAMIYANLEVRATAAGSGTLDISIVLDEPPAIVTRSVKLRVRRR